MMAPARTCQDTPCPAWVLGSSLTVMSGRRFVLRAAQSGIPVAIVNQGPSRGDEYATVLVDAPLGEVLTHLVTQMAR